MNSMRPTLTPPSVPSTPPPNAFVGRQRELADLIAALQRHRLVTITGPGGVGKTRLAAEAARQVTPIFPDGVFFVRLAAIRDELVLYRVDSNIVTKLRVVHQRSNYLSLLTDL